MQAVGIVASVGDSVKHIKVGTSVALMTFGSYAEFVLVLLSMTLVITQLAWCQALQQILNYNFFGKHFTSLGLGDFHIYNPNWLGLQHVNDHNYISYHSSAVKAGDL